MVKKALLGQLGDTDIRLLRIFRVVVEVGGFSAAELELNIGRSTISRHIKDLEIRLGVTLCQRGRGGFSLTPEGRKIYEAALRMLASIDEFRHELDDVHRRLTGTISLAIFDKTATNPNSKIAEGLALLDKWAPDVSIEIYVEPLNEIERGVMDGRFHIGIIPGHRTSTSLNYHQLFTEQMYLYCGEKHELFAVDENAITEKVFLDYQYAGLGYHSPNMESSHQFGLERKATAFDQEGVAHLILSGGYLGFLPEHYAKSFVDAHSIKPLIQSEVNYLCNFNAITRRSPKPSRITEIFLNALINVHQPS